jgi:protein-L-isoaspartate(D-aspartate) O-methyltransferase
MKFEVARRMMVDGQVRTSDVTDLRILGAMLDIPREAFVPAEQAKLAYADLDLAVAAGRRLLKPMVLARLVQAAAVGEEDRVLDVAAATGYSSALLGRLAASVVALEEDVALAGAARDALAGAGAGNVEVVCGPLAKGWPAGAPYAVILVNGAVEVLPESLCRQLKDGGRLVCIEGRGPAAKAMLYRSVGGQVSGRPIFDAAAVPLPGFAKPETFVF